MSSNKDCFKNLRWYYFYIDQQNKKVTYKCKDVDGKDRFFIMQNSNGVFTPLEIDFNSEFSKLIRISFAEGYQGELADQPLECFQAISEVLRNRVNSAGFPDTYSGNIYYPAFKAVNRIEYNTPYSLFHLNANRPIKGFVKTIIGAIKAVYFNSNIANNAICFNKSATISDCGDNVKVVAEHCVHYFWG
ncbi:MAG: hypothetical protein JXL97_03455 [Bacteroidales bacterium]|nr:hypothetical protein [Bacteroidales bacterium]